MDAHDRRSFGGERGRRLSLESFPMRQKGARTAGASCIRSGGCDRFSTLLLMLVPRGHGRDPLDQEDPRWERAIRSYLQPHKKDRHK